MLTKAQKINHYRRCIFSKQSLIRYYEKRGMDEAVQLLEREIAYMELKLKKLGGK